jgi:hypothetical protein
MQIEHIHVIINYATQKVLNLLHNQGEAVARAHHSA